MHWSRWSGRRARERAKTLLFLCQSLLSCEVAKVQDLNICIVCETRQRSLSVGMECLHDKLSGGAPSKLDHAAIEHLLQWAREKALTTIQLLHGAMSKYKVSPSMLRPSPEF